MKKRIGWTPYCIKSKDKHALGLWSCMHISQRKEDCIRRMKEDDEGNVNIAVPVPVYVDIPKGKKKSKRTRSKRD